MNFRVDFIRPMQWMFLNELIGSPVSEPDLRSQGLPSAVGLIMSALEFGWRKKCWFGGRLYREGVRVPTALSPSGVSFGQGLKLQAPLGGLPQAANPRKSSCTMS